MVSPIEPCDESMTQSPLETSWMYLCITCTCISS